MKALVDNSEQGTDGWLKARIPYVTASSVADVMAKGAGTSRNNYMIKMVCETLSGQPTKSFQSKYMQDGNERENDARRIYESITGSVVKQVGFYYLEEEKIGASSDGEVDEDGIIEIKNVIPSEQVRLLTTGKIKPAYLKQMQTQMYVMEKKWCDFVSVSLGDEDYGELPDKYKVKIIRVYRDEDAITEIRKNVAFFHHDMSVMLDKLKELK